MLQQYRCEYPARVEALRGAAKRSPPVVLNGIEYLEVAPDHRTLQVYFVHDLAFAPGTALRESNVEIIGGVRVRNPKVTRVLAQGHVLTVEVEPAGDFSAYLLRLVASPGGDDPPPGIDPALAAIVFSFKADCPSPFDCRTPHECVPESQPAPHIDYLAKDYESFRRLMLDRLSALLPQWTERSPADLMVTLTELVAWRADQLSYFQDAVAAEATLGTARKRSSVRRHARLLDYRLDDGANARTWVVFEVARNGAADGLLLRGCNPETGMGGHRLLTRLRQTEAPVVSEDIAREALKSASAQPFELMHDLELHSSHNEILLHTWSGEECCLPKGATRCFLKDDPKHRLRLKRGHVLVFEEIRSPLNGQKADADPTHRHAVRLTQVSPEAGGPLRTDPVTGDAFVAVQWGAEDAFPFPLCISARVEGSLITDIAVARANVVLADHGASTGEKQPKRVPRDVRRFRPMLTGTADRPLTRQRRVGHAGSGPPQLFGAEASATGALEGEAAATLPAILVESASDGARWMPRADLIGADRFDTAFVVESEDDGRTWLRFGDGRDGRRPDEDDELTITYRVGNGAAGNVGAEAIRHLVGAAKGIDRVRNPLPARGGRNPMPMDQAKLYAPQAFRTQQRAVTLEDYAQMAKRHPDVQRAVARRRWTGSWYTTFLSVDRRGGAEVDAAFEQSLRAFLDPYRLAGHDLEIEGPRFVALDVSFEVCATAEYFPQDVERRLLSAFSSGTLADGTRGVFHPDHFTFGTPVSLSALIARAMRVPGVAFIAPKKFQRWGRNPAGELEAGLIAIGPIEIARLDNDANRPEHGRIEFHVHAPSGARVS
jgi:hypothetical protein